MFRSTVVALCLAAAGLALASGSGEVAGIDVNEWLRLYSGGVNSQVYIPTFRGEGFGVKLTPSSGNYPVRIDQARFYFSGNETGSRGRWRMRIFDDDGPGDTCGTVLLDTLITSHLDRWNTVTIQRDIILRSGSFYVFAYCDTWDISFLPYPHFRFDNDLSPDYLNYDSAPGAGHSFRRWVMPGRIGDPYFEAYVTSIDYDVSVTRLVTPVGVIDSTEYIMPACSVANYGLYAATYQVRFAMGEFAVYGNVVNHAPGSVVGVNFPPIPTFPRGTYAVSCSTRLDGDFFPQNDCQRGTVRIRVRDVVASTVTRPAGDVDSGTVVTPEVIVGNNGTDTAFATVRLTIGTWRDSTPVVVPSGRQVAVEMRAWTALRRGPNALRCSLSLIGDILPENNQFSSLVNVRVHDLVAHEIIEPAGASPPGVFTPRAAVANRGTGREPCTATFSINSVPAYVATITLPDGLPAAETTLVFPRWTGTAGGFTARCSLALATEQLPADNVVSAGFTVGTTDLAVLDIVTPAGGFDTAQHILPAAWVHNLGDGPAAPRVWFAIRDGLGETVYAESLDLGPVLDSALAEFAEWPLPHAPGVYTAACSVAVAFDEDPANDCATGEFTVFTHPPLPAGWSEITNVPLEPSGRPVKDGGWFCPVGDWLYVAKGYKTGDFYRYSLGSSSWQYRASIPLGQEEKQPGKGAVSCTDGERYVYAAKGNNTLGFWRYDTESDSWNALEPVPVGIDRRRVKGGSDMVHVRHPVTDTEYIYLLKGGKTEFYRFNVTDGHWQTMPDAPALDRPKWDKGSWLVFDGDRTIYAHRAKYHDLYRYDIAGDSWRAATLTGMPLQSTRTGRSKKSKDGGSALWQSGQIYALKGGSSNEFYCYDVATATWTELDTIPMIGSSAKKKRVKAGGDLGSLGGQLIAMKGSKSTECWAWGAGVGAGGRRAPAAVQSADLVSPSPRLAVVAPNPLAGRSAVVSWSRPLDAARDITLFDIAGRPVLQAGVAAGRSRVGLDLSGLAAGVYLVRFAGDPAASATKLVIQR